MADAVVIGGGPNGLVCANLLADAGWDVVVLEGQAAPGGAVASADYLGAGYVADVCSAFYPLAAVSPAISQLQLEQHGLEWCHAPAVLAHPTPDGRVALLSRDLSETADGLDRLGAGDGDAWRRLYQLWERLRANLIDALFTPFPPVRAGLRLSGQLGAAGGLRFIRLAALPVRRLIEEEFRGPGALLLAGCALHADLAPESAGSAVYGWLLAMLAQDAGFPVPKGGAGQLTAAMVRRLESRGSRVLCNRTVRSVIVRHGRAVGVVTAGGEEFLAGKAVMADVVATRLYGDLVAWGHLPLVLRDDIRRFQWDDAAFKVDWALDGPVPWEAKETGRAGTVHLADSLDELTQYGADIAKGQVPANPFMLVGQMSVADPSRSPAGTEVLWAYTHVPRRIRGDAGGDAIAGSWDLDEQEAMASRMERRIEDYAPGFRRLIGSRHVLSPQALEEHDPNLVGGAINGGTASVHQQLVFRPVPGLGRPETPVDGLYLASSSAHPGGGVHGACGANAAQAALRARSRVRRVFARPAFAAGRRALYGSQR